MPDIDEVEALDWTPAYQPGVVASDAALEASIEAAPDDLSRWLVYGDWLQTQGDLRGELVLRHQAPDFEEFLDEHLDELLGECADDLRGSGGTPTLRLKWQHGFIKDVFVGVDANWSSTRGLAGVSQALLERPCARFVASFICCQMPYAPLLAPLSARGRTLRRLGLGVEMEGEPFDLHGAGDLSGLWRHLPNLESLELIGDTLRLGHLELPALKRFTLAVSTIGDDLEQSLRTAVWPHLEHLDVMRLPLDAGLLARAPGLTSLASRGLGSAGMISSLNASLRLPQLRQLDLAEGELGSAGFDWLMANAPKLSHLERLDLTNSVSDHQRQALAALSFVVA